MQDQPRGSFHSSSLPLTMLTFVVGIALGWLLHDVIGGTAPQPEPVLRQTSAPAPTGLVPTAAVGQPTSSAPTAAPLPTAPPELTPAPAKPAAPTPEPPPAPLLEPTAAPPEQAIVGYAGHVVEPGESLASIAARGGSAPDLVARYNLLDGEPAAGRALIVPRIAGKASTIESQPLLVSKGRADKPWVALTLDAGASAEPVPQILETLREHHVTITFFLTGTWIKENPDLTRQIVADGHEIANHTFTHPDMRNLSQEAIHKELDDTEALLEETAGATARPLFRPPYGAYDERVLRLVVGEGYLPIYWTLDSLDSVGEPKTPDFLFERITGKLAPDQLRGAIILAHCGSQPTADALPHILDRFAEMGFEVKKVSEVLGG